MDQSLEVQHSAENDVEILEANREKIASAKDKGKVKKGKKGNFTITKYNLITGVALIVQTILDKAGVFGKILGAGLGQIATNHYNQLCSMVSNYVVDNKLYSNPAFTQIFSGHGPFYNDQLANFNQFMSTANPTTSQLMNGGIAVNGIIEQSTIMNIIGTVIQFVIQNPALVIMPAAALTYEVIKRIVKAIKEKIQSKKNNGENVPLAQQEETKGKTR